MASDRLFHVIVLGGIGLVGVACGTTVESPGQATGGTSGSTDSGVGGFPQEGAIAIVDAGADDAMDAFPSEGPMMIDAGFPNETDQAADAGAAPDADAGFPQEAPPP